MKKSKRARFSTNFGLLCSDLQSVSFCANFWNFLNFLSTFWANISTNGAPHRKSDAGFESGGVELVPKHLYLDFFGGSKNRQKTWTNPLWFFWAKKFFVRFRRATYADGGILSWRIDWRHRFGRTSRTFPAYKRFLSFFWANFPWTQKIEAGVRFD